jgi:hypothetical protein
MGQFTLSTKTRTTQARASWSTTFFGSAHLLSENRFQQAEHPRTQRPERGHVDNLGDARGSGLGAPRFGSIETGGGACLRGTRPAPSSLKSPCSSSTSMASSRPPPSGRSPASERPPRSSLWAFSVRRWRSRLTASAGVGALGDEARIERRGARQVLFLRLGSPEKAAPGVLRRGEVQGDPRSEPRRPSPTRLASPAAARQGEHRAHGQPAPTPLAQPVALR